MLLSSIGAIDENCKWTKYDVAPEVYYINMDVSANRKISMEKHLTDVGFKYHRVRGITPDTIYIPEDVNKTWQTANCKVKTSWVPPVRDKKTETASSEYASTPYFMSSLCGRGKGSNTMKELGCTTSHLLAMREAVYSNSKSRYALIVEDDVQFPFDVDWEALAHSAPEGFQILQLFNSNELTMMQTYKTYQKHNFELWSNRDHKKFFRFWSTCAYLIDRVAMKEIIDAIAFKINGWTSFSVIAGLSMNPCVPAACCVNGTDFEHFIHKPPCVWAPQGFQAGAFLFFIYLFIFFLFLLIYFQPSFILSTGFSLFLFSFFH